MDYLQQIFSEVQLLVPTTGAIIAGVLACVLLIFSGYASGSEIALREESERTLATILITNNLVNVTIIMLANYFIAHVIDFGMAYWLEFVVITVLLTFLLLLFGEIMPKVYASQHALSFCRFSAPGIVVLRKLFYPLASILLRSGMLAEKVVQKENHVLSVDDLEQALELTDENELKEEKNMLEGIVRFGDETAKEVMTSRQDVVDLDFRTSFADVLKCVVENNYSRIPVYQGSIDNIRGILYIKDLLPYLLSDFYKILDLDDETFENVQGDADSLAGMLLEIKGDFPELHERIDFQNFTFEVTELDGHRISKIKVVIHEQSVA